MTSRPASAGETQEAHVVGFCLPGLETRFAWWLQDDSPWNTIIARGGRIAWWQTEAAAEAAASAVVPAGYVVVRDPQDPAICDIDLLLKALVARRPASEFDLLTVIDLLDEVSHQAQLLLGLAPAAAQGAEAFNPLRSALFDGASWEESVDEAGGRTVLQRAVFSHVGEIVLASNLSEFR